MLTLLIEMTEMVLGFLIQLTLYKLGNYMNGEVLVFSFSVGYFGFLKLCMKWKNIFLRINPSHLKFNCWDILPNSVCAISYFL